MCDQLAPLIPPALIIFNFTICEILFCSIRLLRVIILIQLTGKFNYSRRLICYQLSAVVLYQPIAKFLLELHVTLGRLNKLHFIQSYYICQISIRFKIHVYVVIAECEYIFIQYLSEVTYFTGGRPTSPTQNSILLAYPGHHLL